MCGKFSWELIFVVDDQKFHSISTSEYLAIFMYSYKEPILLKLFSTTFAILEFGSKRQF